LCVLVIHCCERRMDGWRRFRLSCQL